MTKIEADYLISDWIKLNLFLDNKLEKIKTDLDKLIKPEFYLDLLHSLHKANLLNKIDKEIIDYIYLNALRNSFVAYLILSNEKYNYLLKNKYFKKLAYKAIKGSIHSCALILIEAFKYPSKYKDMPRSIRRRSLAKALKFPKLSSDFLYKDVVKFLPKNIKNKAIFSAISDGFYAIQYLKNRLDLLQSKEAIRLAEISCLNNEVYFAQIEKIGAKSEEVSKVIDLVRFGFSLKQSIEKIFG